jgi:hypothetical protein
MFLLATFFRLLRVRGLAGLNRAVRDRVLRSLVEGDGFQTHRRQFERVTMSCVIASPDRRSGFFPDLAGQTKLRKFNADFAKSRALDRRRAPKNSDPYPMLQRSSSQVCVVSLTHMIQAFDRSRGPAGPGLTTTIPGSVNAAGAVEPCTLARRLRATPPRKKSQAFL